MGCRSHFIKLNIFAELLRIGSAERKDPQIQQFLDLIFGSRSFLLDSPGSDLLDPYFVKKIRSHCKENQTASHNSEDGDKMSCSKGLIFSMAHILSYVFKQICQWFLHSFNYEIENTPFPEYFMYLQNVAKNYALEADRIFGSGSKRSSKENGLDLRI